MSVAENTYNISCADSVNFLYNVLVVIVVVAIFTTATTTIVYYCSCFCFFPSLQLSVCQKPVRIAQWGLYVSGTL
jgi:hypothetical protein